MLNRKKINFLIGTWRLVKLLLPRVIVEKISNLKEKYYHKKYENLSIDKIFTKIYEEKQWGEHHTHPFFSGAGSHNKDISEPYIEAVREYIISLDFSPVVVDIGSGDFNIGSKLVDLAKYYYACDVVSTLQSFCNTKFSYENLEFVVCDAIEHPLPSGDIVIIRQVLQHISNAQIKKIIKKCRKFDKWIITEHIPLGTFEPNKDFNAGSGIRVLFGSGVDLTEAPFSVKDYNTKVLCETPQRNGVIKTILFENNNNSQVSDITFQSEN